MLTTLLITLLVTSIAAIPTVPENADRRNVFERQLVCLGVTACTSSASICCGYNCCSVGCDISGTFCSSTPTSVCLPTSNPAPTLLKIKSLLTRRLTTQTCKLTEVSCGGDCCDLLQGYYCGSSNTCLYASTTNNNVTTHASILSRTYRK